MTHPRSPWRPRPVLTLLAFGLVALTGCGSEHPAPEVVWGRRGVPNGDLARPRAIAIDGKDHLYIVDFTARIQVYDRDGRYLGPTWTTPDYRNGRPSGLSMARDGNLLVCDSHYHCVRKLPHVRKLLPVGNPESQRDRQLGQSPQSLYELPRIVG